MIIKKIKFLSSMVFIKVGIALFITSLFSIEGYAQERNDIPSCYDYAKLKNVKPSAHKNTLFVIVDQTLDFSDKLMEVAIKKVKQYMQNNTGRIEMIVFSTHSGDHYTKTIFAGNIEEDLSQNIADDVSSKKLKKFRSCLKKQHQFGSKKVDKTLDYIFQSRPEGAANTELLYTLNNVIAKGIKQSNATHKIVLLISDMIENSNLTSFYDFKNRSFRIINSAEELSKLNQIGGVTDFGNAKIYVHGGGYNKARGYLPGEIMHPIKVFWRDYFNKAGAELIGFGEPELMEELK